MFDDFMTADILSTYIGLTAAVTTIVQFTKSIIKRRFGSSVVRLYAFIIALALTFIFTPHVDGAKGLLTTIINAMMITIASLGSYEVITNPMAEK